MVGVEAVLLNRRPDLVVVYGDVNSTLAAALAAVKVGIEVAHVEAGLRSGDRTMPEEINRILTDRLSTQLYTPSEDGTENLLAEGVPAAWIRCVGNVMIDTLKRLLPMTRPEAVLRRLGLSGGTGPRQYALVTLHRPAIVDDPVSLRSTISALSCVADDIPVVFPMHPRTRHKIEAAQIDCGRVCVTQPLTYLEFLGLQQHATLVITDSGGIQEETTFLGIPCLTMRDNTERPITITLGTNQLIGRDASGLNDKVAVILRGNGKKGTIPPLWDGNAGNRIADHIIS
jgi:UDP-N-acetylglucosamine 2-epimerase (non-hydrolysing)